MSAELADLRRRVEATAWGQSGWIPEMAEIRWPALDTWRREHEAAVEKLAKAKGDDAVINTVITVCEVVEEATDDLRRRQGLAFNPSSSAGRPDEWKLSYAKVRDELANEPQLRDLPVGHRWITEALEAGKLTKAQAELARRRERVSEDLDRSVALRLKIDGDVRLVEAEILTLAVAESRTARAELGQTKTGAVATG